MKIGETFTMDVTVSRRWWQLWKPRTWTERRLFVAKAMVTGQNTVKVDLVEKV